MWFHFGCVRLSSDQVRRIKEYVCGRCEDFSGARTTWKSAEELEEEELEEEETEEERRRERKGRFVVKGKPLGQGGKKRKLVGRGVKSEVLVVEDEEVDEGDGVVVDGGEENEVSVGLQDDGTES